MKNIRITKRDIKVFLLGMLTFFLLETVFYWDEAVADFKSGFEAGSKAFQEP